MPNPITNFTDSNGIDLGNKLITKEYLMSVYPQIGNQLITPELWVWGKNSYANLGDNTTTTKTTPVTTFSGGANWKQVSSSGYHTAAIKTDGSLWTWGYNAYGELGDNTTTNRTTPVTTFSGGVNWKQVSVGVYNTSAIKTDGTLWTWGRNNIVQIGDNTGTNRCTPVTTFAGGTNWKQVSSIFNHMAAIKTDGTLWTWGNNAYGQLGDNTKTNRCTPITTFLGGNNWKQVFVFSHTAAVKTNGTLWTWGRNSYGQLGDNTKTNRCTPVTTFAGGTNWKQVSNTSTTLAIKTDGTLWTWGYNAYGNLGDNTTTDKCTPVTTFAGGTNWKQVSFSSAIKTDGTLWVWGSNNGAYLGDNTTTDRCTPVTTFAGGTNWKQVSIGAAIKTSDDLRGI